MAAFGRKQYPLRKSGDSHVQTIPFWIVGELGLDAGDVPEFDFDEDEREIVIQY